MRDASERAAERAEDLAKEEAAFKDVVLRTKAGDVDILDLLVLYERDRADVLYAKRVLGDCDVYASGGLDGMVREAATRMRERDARIDELQARGSELENERRMWKLRASTLRQLLDAALIELTVGFEKALEDSSETRDFAAHVEPMFRRTLAMIQRVANRADALEADAWCKAVGVARDFVKAVKDLPVAGDTEGDYRVWIWRWKDRFETALKS